MVKLLDSRAIRGANYYSYRPVVVLNVDLGEYHEVFMDALPGFTDALLELVPSLEEHRCSENERGGLIKRMREGTLLGHVIEHLALELQYIAGMEVGFGKTIDTDTSGVYQVIYSYWVEEAGITAGERAIDIVNALLEGRRDDIDLEGVIRELEDIGADHYLGPSTAAIVEEAEHRGITVLRLDDYNLVQLGEGKHQRRIEASITVMGHAVVCVVDAHGAEPRPAVAGEGRGLSVSGLALHVLAEGDRFDLGTRTVWRG